MLITQKYLNQSTRHWKRKNYVFVVAETYCLNGIGAKLLMMLNRIRMGYKWFGDARVFIQKKNMS